jgi:hypothetical protein
MDAMRGALVCLLSALLSAGPAAAEDGTSPLGMSYVETPDLTLIYFDPLGYLVPHATRTFKQALDWQRRMFEWTPSEAPGVLLKDFSDYGGAAAWAAPRDTLFLDIAPLSLAFETFPAAERMYSLMNHETVHLATSDVASEADRRWRRLFFGKVPPQSENPESLLYGWLTVPRFMAPRWYLEGSAVFMETWMNGGLGRAQGGYDEMVFRAMVRDDAHFYDPLGLVSRGIRSDFQVGANAYLYGTRFFTWLAWRYSPEKVFDWLKRDEASRRSYADQFEQVFGIALEQGWRDWIAFEREFQRANLERVREHPITPVHRLRGAVGSISRTYYDEASGILYGAFRYPGVVEHVGALNTRDGSLRILADIKRAMLYRVASFAYDPASGTAFYTNDNLALRDLMAVDVKTGRQRMLLEDARIGEIVFNPVDRSLMGVRHANGLASLVRVPYPYSAWTEVHAFPYGVVPYDLDISPDGKLLSASVNEVNADQFLRVWPLERVLAGEMKPLSEFRFGQSVPESFVFSRDGRYLYGSSYYTGVSNIFRYEVASGAVEAVSNAESGLFRPLPLADGRLMVLTYTAEGFVPAIIEPRPIEDVSAIKFLGAEVAATHPVVTTWQVPPGGVEEQPITRRGPYAPLDHVALRNAYPVLQGYKNTAGLGYRFNFEDPIRFASFSLTAAYTPAGSLPGGERGHLAASGRYLGWRGELAWNKSDFYDLSGPTKRSRKGFAAKLGYDRLLIYDEPRKLELRHDLAYYSGIDTLPGAQNVGTPFTRLLEGQLGLHFTDVRRSLGAVDDEKGVISAAVLAAHHANDRTVAQLRGQLDVGIALPLAHASLWSRSALGAASGERGNTLANFYFGGFGNNRVDNGAVKRYRDYDAMPGFGLNEISGLGFARQMFELNLPPLGFESVGTPSLHLSWLRPALFATALWTDPGSAARRTTYSNLGTQIDLRFSLLHWYEMTLSAGFAVGYKGSRRAGSEWMISLKIL